MRGALQVVVLVHEAFPLAAQQVAGVLGLGRHDRHLDHRAVEHGLAAVAPAVDGVDVLLIGTNDLCAEMGIPGEFGHEKVEAAYDAALAAAKKHGKHVGLGGIYDEGLVTKFVAKGVRFILGGADLGFVMAAASARSAFLRSLEAS